MLITTRASPWGYSRIQRFRVSLALATPWLVHLTISLLIMHGGDGRTESPREEDRRSTRSRHHGNEARPHTPDRERGRQRGNARHLRGVAPHASGRAGRHADDAGLPGRVDGGQ